jgi:hypothetical protein
MFYGSLQPMAFEELGRKMVGGVIYGSFDRAGLGLVSSH